MHSWTSNLRRVGLGFMALGLAGAAYAASTGNELGTSADDAACCQLTTSLVNDVLRGKDVAGDERFFATDGAPPNIHFLVDASGSMQELPQVLNSGHKEFFAITTNGCDNPRLDAYETAHNWDQNFQYPVPDTGTGLGADTGFPNLFRDDKFYAYMYWGYSSSPSYQWNTKEEACQSQVPDWNTARTADYNRCVQCLGTKGYWKLPEAEARDQQPWNNLDFILWGRFLNFDPPKYVTAKAVLKSVIKDLKRVRAGISVFTVNTNPVLTDLLQPQNPSCSQILNDSSAFDNNRASYINSINGLAFQTGTPLARSLLNVGYYFTSDTSIYQTQFGFGAAYGYPNEFKNGALTSQGRSVCWGCQTSSVIIITDGEPSGDSVGGTLASAIRAVNGGPVYCPDSAPCSVTGTGCGVFDHGCNVNNVADDNANLYLDDVAKFLYEKDLQANIPPQVGDFNTAGKQSIVTYAVGFGINSNLLKNTADVGGGLYFTADDATSLKQALLDIISNVQTRATSFSSPAASSLQVRAASSTLIPRFKPARSKVEPWQGFLYRFKEGPERLLGCDPKNPAGGGDLNGDGDCDDTLLIDKDGDAVTEDDEGQFVKLNNPLTPAKPFWEAGQVLRPGTGNTTQWMTRKIYTIVDNGAGGYETGNKSFIDFNDTPIAFDVTNASDVNLLREYMGIPNTANACPELAAKLGVGTLSGTDCAKVLIKWYRGADALNPDPLLRDYDRPFLLGDIFHSAPANVDPPINKNLCALSTTCLMALFAGSTPQEHNYVTSRTNDAIAYDKYVDSMANRDKIALVGSNDGMLHAFANGKATSAVDTFTGQYIYDDGTGKELWAFIPPDMLPKLRPNIGKHGYFVDGSPMVREVWMDGLKARDLPADLNATANNKKEAGEYHTVAIIGTGRGGVHRFALDLTRLLGTDPGESLSRLPEKGDFLWMWPQPCDPLALQVGESFSNFSPRAPPIGPVALTDAADEALRGFTLAATAPGAGPWTIDSTSARERWVVGFNGGYDEHMLRGRGMAMVDVASGRTVWSFFYGDGQNRSANLKYPFAAGISMFDIDQANVPLEGNTDRMWDSATVGDYGGQLWMVRFWKPGVWDSAKGRVSNWYAARSFRVANLAGKTSDADAMRAPFAYATVNGMQPDTGFVRTFLGTGDKENLLEKGTACRLSNPVGCAMQGCGVNNTLVVKRGTDTTLTTNSTYVNYHFSSGNSTPGTEGQSCAGSEVTLTWNNDSANGCSNSNDGSIQYKCDGDANTWNCRETQNTWAQLNYLQTTPPFPQRYYGIYTYGGQSTARRFDDDTAATAYDNSLLTDTNLMNVGQFDTAGKVVTASEVAAPAAGNGWFIQYGPDNERTATSGTLESGCVLFRTFEPSGASGAVCSTTGTNIARTYQAHFATGVANCAAGFYDKDANNGNGQWARYIQGTTVAAPAEPTSQIAIGGGQISLGISLPEPGQGAGGSSGGSHIQIQTTDDGVKSLYQLELDRRGHECRHNGQSCD